MSAKRRRLGPPLAPLAFVVLAACNVGCESSGGPPAGVATSPAQPRASASPAGSASGSTASGVQQGSPPTTVAPPPPDPAPPPPPFLGCKGITDDGKPHGLAAPAVAVPTSGAFGAVDMHVDSPYQIFIKGKSLAMNHGQASLSQLKAGRYIGITYPIYIPDYLNQNNPRIKDADAIFATIDKMVARHDVLKTVFEGSAPLDAGDVAVFVSIEGAGAFAQDITQIDRFIARGVRLIGPVHMHDNKLASSSTGAGPGYGLSDLGKAFARRVYCGGALMDVSHLSDAGFDDLVPIAQLYQAPIVATHSNARALRNHARNLSDAQLKSIAKSGGIVGLNLHSPYVTKATATIPELVKQAKHLISVMGIDHVGLGTDFDGGRPVKGLENAGKMQRFADALIVAGLTDAQVRKLFGGNALRILYWSGPPQAINRRVGAGAGRE